MKRCETLQEMVEYLVRKHKDLHRMQGVYGYKFIKRRDGFRVPFEEVNRLSLRQFGILGDNSLSIELCGLGYEFGRGKSAYPIEFSSRLILNNLAVINAYDYKTEFFSFDGIDFIYMQLNEAARLQLHKEWILEQAGTIRAQWAAKLPEVDKILAEVGTNRKVSVMLQPTQTLDLEASIF